MYQSRSLRCLLTVDYDLTEPGDDYLMYYQRGVSKSMWYEE